METWILEHPDVLRELQQSYLEAGSQVLLAPTFGANRAVLERNGIFGEVERYNRELAALTRQTAQGRALTAADLSPTGRFLSPMGDASFEELVEVYTEQAAALERAGVDLFVVETAMTMPEIRAAVLAIRSVSKKPIFVTVTCDAGGRTLTGTDVTAALLVMQGMGVDAFGLNCSTGPEGMMPHIRRLRQYAQVPLIVKPNAGLPELEGEELVYHCPPEEFTAMTGEFAAEGVAVFGGCCGTTAAHIAALKEKTRGLRPAPPAPCLKGKLPCSTETQPQLLDPDTPGGSVLHCTERLLDELEAAAEDPSPVVTVAVEEEAELKIFAECQYAMSKALYLTCGDAALLEKALRIYQGRARYAGSLPARELAPLVKRYGLVL